MARIGLVAVVCDRRRTSIPPDRLRRKARLAVPATVRVIASAALAWDVRSYVPFPPASCGRKYAGDADVVDKSAQKNFRIGGISTFLPRRPAKSILFLSGCAPSFLSPFTGRGWPHSGRVRGGANLSRLAPAPHPPFGHLLPVNGEKEEARLHRHVRLESSRAEVDTPPP